MNKNTLRSIGAVVAGALVGILLSIGGDAVMRMLGFFSPDKSMNSGPFAVATAYRTFFGIASAYLTARLAPSRPMMHALILGALGFAASLAGAVAMWDKMPAIGPKWYAVALVVLALPPAWLGAKLRVMQLRADT
jgi:hypothetical protein